MYDSLPSAAFCDPSVSEATPARQGHDLEPELAEASPLDYFSIREDRYWLERKEGDVDGPRPSVLISTDLLMTGGFVAGRRLGANADISLRYIDGTGRVFECLCRSHRPWRLVHFLGRGFVRIRLFSDLVWLPANTSPFGNSSYHGRVLLAVTDTEGKRHRFVFPVAPRLRRLFLVAALQEVT